MIGRTNVPQRKVPVINGDLNSYTVDTGNTIQKGDFVSLKQITPLGKLNTPFGQIFDSQIFDLANGLVICSEHSGGGSLKLNLCGAGNNFEVFDSYVVGTYGTTGSTDIESVYCYFCITANKKVACVVNNIFYCFSVNTTTKKFVLDCEIKIQCGTFYDQNSFGLISICEVESGKFICVGNGKASSSSSTYYFGFLQYDFDETVVFDFLVYSMSYLYDASYPLYSYGGKVFALHTSWLNCLSVDFVNKTVTKDYGTAVQSNVRIKSNCVSFNKDMVCFVDSNSSTKKAYVYRFGVSSAVLLNSITPNYVIARAVFVNDHDILISSYQNQSGSWYGIYVMFCKNVDGVVVTSSILIDSSYSSGASCIGIFVNNKLYFCYRDTYTGYNNVAILNVIDDEVALPLSETVVTEYDGYGSIGFATVGGNAGDTIQVYVPHTSS